MHKGTRGWLERRDAPSPPGRSWTSMPTNGEISQCQGTTPGVFCWGVRAATSAAPGTAAARCAALSAPAAAGVLPSPEARLLPALIAAAVGAVAAGSPLCCHCRRRHHRLRHRRRRLALHPAYEVFCALEWVHVHWPFGPAVSHSGQNRARGGRCVGLVGGVTQTVLEGDAPVCPSFDEVGADHLPTEILS